jgi:hypothetical protein
MCSSKRRIRPAASQQIFLPRIETLATPIHEYHYNAQTNSKEIEHGPNNGSTKVPTNLEIMTWCPQTVANTNIYPYIRIIYTTKVINLLGIAIFFCLGFVSCIRGAICQCCCKCSMISAHRSCCIFTTTQYDGFYFPCNLCLVILTVVCKYMQQVN